MTSIDWFIVVWRGLTEMISDRSLPIFFSVMADYPLIPIFPGFFFAWTRQNRVMNALLLIFSIIPVKSSFTVQW